MKKLVTLVSILFACNSYANQHDYIERVNYSIDSLIFQNYHIKNNKVLCNLYDAKDNKLINQIFTIIAIDRDNVIIQGKTRHTVHLKAKVIKCY